MFVADYVTRRPNEQGSRTYHDFSQFLGRISHRVGLVATLCKGHTVSAITDRIENIVYQDIPKRGTKSINAFAVEWDINVKFIRRIEFAAVPEGDGIGGAEIRILFKERYYDKHDTIVIDKSHQQLYVTRRPRWVSNQYFEYICRIIDNDGKSYLDKTACQPGMTTHWLSNAHPYDYHDFGTTKYQSNMECHRNYMTLHRNDIDASQAYVANEDVFLKVSDTEVKGSEKLFTMTSMEKTLIENFLEAKSKHDLWARSNVDANGKPTIIDPETQRPVYIGDGIIPQIERYAYLISFDTLLTSHFKEAMKFMRSKADHLVGNSWVVICNSLFWNQVGDNLQDYIAQWTPTAALMYSKATGGKRNIGETVEGGIKVGNTFTAYEYQGNEITFMPDRALDIEYPDQAFGFILDLTPTDEGKPAIESWTFKGADMLKTDILGVGGLDGVSGGTASTPVAGLKQVYWGYSAISVYCPHKAVIFRQNPQ